MALLDRQTRTSMFTLCHISLSSALSRGRHHQWPSLASCIVKSNASKSMQHHGSPFLVTPLHFCSLCHAGRPRRRLLVGKGRHLLGPLSLVEIRELVVLLLPTARYYLLPAVQPIPPSEAPLTKPSRLTFIVMGRLAPVPWVPQ